MMAEFSVNDLDPAIFNTIVRIPAHIKGRFSVNSLSNVWYEQGIPHTPWSYCVYPSDLEVLSPIVHLKWLLQTPKIQITPKQNVEACARALLLETQVQGPQEL